MGTEISVLVPIYSNVWEVLYACRQKVKVVCLDWACLTDERVGSIITVMAPTF